MGLPKVLVLNTDQLCLCEIRACPLCAQAQLSQQQGEQLGWWQQRGQRSARAQRFCPCSEDKPQVPW